VDAATALLLEDTPPTAASLAEALLAAGSDLPGAQALRAPLGDAAARSRFLRAARERADAPLVCGEAESETMRLLLVTPRAGRLTVATADEAVGAERAPGPGESAVVRATTPTPSERLEVSLAPRFRDAYLAGRDAEDRMHRWAVDEDVLARGFVMSPDVPRPVVVQLVASGPDGPRPISRVVLGQQDALREAPSVDGDDNLATRVATLRATEGVRELRVNRLLVAEAAAHAARVCSTARCATRASPATRTTRACACSIAASKRAWWARRWRVGARCGRAAGALGEPFAPHDAGGPALHRRGLRHRAGPGRHVRRGALRRLATLRSASLKHPTAASASWR
jgi:hypothetical protein